jgi:hypothetical protein
MIAPMRTVAEISADLRRLGTWAVRLADEIEQLAGGDPIAAFKGGRMIAASRAACREHDVADDPRMV